MLYFDNDSLLLLVPVTDAVTWQAQWVLRDVGVRIEQGVCGFTEGTENT